MKTWKGRVCMIWQLPVASASKWLLLWLHQCTTQTEMSTIIQPISVLWQTIIKRNGSNSLGKVTRSVTLVLFCARRWSFWSDTRRHLVSILSHGNKYQKGFYASMWGRNYNRNNASCHPYCPQRASCWSCRQDVCWYQTRSGFKTAV